MKKEDLRLLFLHEFKLGNNAAKTTANINKAWGESTASERTVQRWYQKFCGGDETLKDEDGRGRPPIIQNEDLRAIVEQIPQQRVREMSTQLGVRMSTVSDHQKQIKKVKKLEKWVPHELNERQRVRRFELCLMLFLRDDRVPFLDCLVSCDEKWISMIIGNDHVNGLTMMSHRNIFQDRNCTHRK